MPLTDELSKAQRVVVVVALGLALAVTGAHLTGPGSGTGFGWYAYSPLTTTLRAPGTGLAAWLGPIIWPVLIGLWALAAIRVPATACGQERGPAVRSSAEECVSFRARRFR
jgi:heme/copper-type cytochrome/quinol oxidase subunit 1